MTRLPSRKWIAPLLLAALLAPAFAAYGVAADERREKLRVYIVGRLAEELELSKEDAAALGGIYRESEVKQLGLAERLRKAEDRLRIALDGGETGSLKKLVSEVNELDRKIALVRPERTLEIQGTLSREQGARFLVIRQALEKEIKQAIKRRR